MRVFFGTDRRSIPAPPRPSESFGRERSSVVTYGTCDVSIPRYHRIGRLESPSLVRLELRENPEKHVILVAVRPLQQDDFFDQLRLRVLKSQKRNSLVFVHGFNVSFATAARRTAQISYDLGFDGAPAFFSWPSQEKLSKTGYMADGQSVEWAEPHLTQFLDDFLQRSGADHIYLIAHSMGNRGLVRALKALFAQKPASKGRISEVILTAPDIDAQVFRRDLVPSLVDAGLPVTLYASSKDRALAIARNYGGGYPRAGESGTDLVVVQGIETIDATDVDTDLIGHFYYAEERSVLSDVYSLVVNGERADHRFGLRGVDGPNGRYWAFKK